MTFEELKAIIDEALVRLGPDWSMTVLSNAAIKLQQAGKEYHIRILLGWNMLEVTPQYNDSRLGRYYSTHSLRFNTKFNLTSAKLADAIQVKLIPQMEELYARSLAAMANEDVAPVLREETGKELKEACPRLTPNSAWSSNLVLRREGELNYMEIRNDYRLIITPRVENGVAVCEINGALPKDLTIELAKKLDAFLHPEAA